MSVQSEITRILTARNTLRTKAVALGIGTSTDDITDLAAEYNGITDRGTPSSSIQEGDSYTILAGYYHGGTIQAVAGGGNYTLQAKTVTPTKSEQSVSQDNGYYGLSSVTVNPIPDAYQDVSSVTAVAADVLATKIIVDSSGNVITGTMTNRGTWNSSLTVGSPSVTVPSGYHSGSGTVSISLEDKTFTPSETTQTYELASNSSTFVKKVVVNPIPDDYADASDTTATAGDILYGVTAVGYDSSEGEATVLTGTMPNNGAVSQTLQAGGSYTVPAGYHNGSGTVSAASLASQTGVDSGKTAIGAEQVLTGYQGWVNGSKVTGAMADNGAWSFSPKVGELSATVPAGYHNGSGTVSITTESKTFTPSESTQTYSVASNSSTFVSSITVNPIPSNYADASETDAVAGNILYGKTAIGYDSTDHEAVTLTGTMPNNGAVSQTLQAGGSYTVPAGYHNGSGTVTAASLASQTGVDNGKTAIDAAYVLTGYQGWVNGTKVSGSMANNGAISGTITGLGSVTGDTYYTIPAGYTSGGTVSLTNDIETALAAI